jgi:hypothetical protein
VKCGERSEASPHAERRSHLGVLTLLACGDETLDHEGRGGSEKREKGIFSPADEQEIWRVFSQYADKAWSYTDCACRVLAQQRGIGQAFTFDRHFAQMGLEMAPATQP